jgi:hypothetical protein
VIALFGFCVAKALYSLRAIASRRSARELGVREMVMLAFGVLGAASAVDTDGANVGFIAQDFAMPV